MLEAQDVEQLQSIILLSSLAVDKVEVYIHLLVNLAPLFHHLTYVALALMELINWDMVIQIVLHVLENRRTVNGINTIPQTILGYILTTLVAINAVKVKYILHRLSN